MRATVGPQPWPAQPPLPAALGSTLLTAFPRIPESVLEATPQAWTRLLSPWGVEVSLSPLRPTSNQGFLSLSSTLIFLQF